MLQRFAVSFKSRDSFSKGTLPLPFTDTHLCVTLTFLNNRSALMEGLAKAKVSSEGSGAGKKQEMRASCTACTEPSSQPCWVLLSAHGDRLESPPFTFPRQLLPKVKLQN